MLNIKETQQLVNAELEKINFVTEPQELYTPIAYTLAQGGKRIRPVLCLMAAQLFGHQPEKILYPALGLEVFHNFTLLHDDIMDNAEVRRNNPTVHKKWNTNAAILSGDAMMIKAHQFVCQCDPDKLPKVIALFNAVALGVCEGQQYDMEFETRNDVTVEEYLEMIRLKTAILLAGSLKMGAILANASVHEAELIYHFGINIGLAFQLQDDFLDTFGNQDTFGKKIGGDIIANKKTFLLLTALKKAEKEDKRNLMDWITVEDFDYNEKIEAVKKIYVKLSVDTASKNKMKEYYEKAIHCLSQIDGDYSVKNELENFASKLMQRIN
ncbi:MULTISPECIES: polyprenyl synthetase family protein [unclassified Saccharicrinis]|uniref:polyprenyl synthetase family protein n=1 Tax=unclassified Saccharicrinis TaxID=2646859 RepID=UPI003D32DA9D